MGVNLFIAERSNVAVSSPSHAESQRANPTDEKIKTTLANLSVKESDHEEEKKVAKDCSKKREGCSSSKKIETVRRLSLEKTEEKKENEEEPLIFIIANQEIQLPPSYKERLARDSDFFRGLFTHPMQETITGEYKVEDIDFEDFQKIITLWSGDSTASAQEAFDLLEVGSRLGLGEPLAKILIPTIKNWSLTDVEDLETACALSHASPFFASLPSLTSELEIFLVKAYLAANDEAQNLLESIQALNIRDLNLSESSVDDGKLENLISACPNLGTLALQRTCITDRSAEQIAKLSKLTTLDVSECRYLTDAAVEPLIKLPNLASLNVSCCRLTDAGLEQIATFPNLNNLNLMGCEQLSGTGLRSVCKLSNLRALNLSGWLKGGLEWIATQLPNLTSLQLRDCQLTNADLQWIAKLTHLTSLDISRCKKVTDVGFEEIAKLLNLTKLDVCGCEEVTDAGIALIADKLTKLTGLDLGDCEKLTDVALEHISRLSNLEELSLKSCVKITDTGLEMIASLTKLTRLNISYCIELTHNSMQHIIKLTNLIALSMRGSGMWCSTLVSDRAMEFIPKLRHLRVLDVNNCKLLTNKGLNYICELSHLESLNIGRCSRLTDDSYVSIAKLLNLTHLDLEWSSNLTKESMQLVAEKCDQLTSLNLTNCEALVKDLIEIAPLLPNLTTLNLSANQSAKYLTESNIVQIAKHFSKLTHLGISSRLGVTNSLIKQLAPLLPDLKSLDISWSKHLTDEGIRELVVYRNLRELNVTMCQSLTNASIDHMIQVPRLVSIQLGSSNSITKSGIHKMRSQAIRVRKNSY